MALLDGIVIKVSNISVLSHHDASIIPTEADSSSLLCPTFPLGPPPTNTIQVVNILVFASIFGSNLYSVLGPSGGYGKYPRSQSHNPLTSR